MSYIFFGKQEELFERSDPTMEKEKLKPAAEVYEVVRPGDTLRVRDAYGRVVVIRGRYAVGFTRLFVFLLGLGLGLMVSRLW